LHDFLEEMQQLERNGLEVGSARFSVSIHSYVCDAPARAFLKCVKSYSGYYGCERCIQSGMWADKMTFPETVATLRTDQDFKDMTQEEHHLGTSPLAGLSAGLVSHFVLDYMHLVCLGVTRRLITTWIKGPLSTRLPTRSVIHISERLLRLRSAIPCEFARKPRALCEIDRWKATEFRQFLLYTGVVVLRGILMPSVYNNFLILSVAIRCLCSSELYSSHCDYAQQLLLSFVTHACELYGEGFIVYNVHALVHIANDVSKFGPLDRISAFPFENSLRKLKMLVRKSHLPLQQLVMRVTEQQQQGGQTTATIKLDGVSCHKPHCNGPVPRLYESAVQYSVYKSRSCVIKLTTNNNCILTKNGEVGRVQNILKINSDIFFAYRKFGKIQNCFEYPMQSREIDIFVVSRLQQELLICSLQEMSCKCVCLPDEGGQVFTIVPLLHNDQ